MTELLLIRVAESVEKSNLFYGEYDKNAALNSVLLTGFGCESAVVIATGAPAQMSVVTTAYRAEIYSADCCREIGACHSE